MGTAQLYDALGHDSRANRRPDSWLAAAIRDALGGASATALPFGDGAFAAALAVLTVHHRIALSG